jgi:hypothetical protein
MTRSTKTSKTARKARIASKAALSRYLAAGLGATGLASVECEAAIVNLNISALGTPAQNMSAVNAVGDGVFITVSNIVPTAVTGGVANAMGVWNNASLGERGLTPFTATEFLTGSVYTSPTNLTDGTLVGATGSSRVAMVKRQRRRECLVRVWWRARLPVVRVAQLRSG